MHLSLETCAMLGTRRATTAAADLAEEDHMLIRCKLASGSAVRRCTGRGPPVVHVAGACSCRLACALASRLQPGVADLKRRGILPSFPLPAGLSQVVSAPGDPGLGTCEMALRSARPLPRLAL